MTPDNAMQLVRSSMRTRTVARALLGALALALAALALMPWQQTAAGEGHVIAYLPTQRPQVIDAPIEGRVAQWHVIEGQAVRRGEALVELVDNDPQLMQRLQEERTALLARIEAVEHRAQANTSQLDALGTSRESALAATDARLRMARQRERAAKQALEATQATLATARLNQTRQRELAAKGLAAQRQVELADLEVTKALTESERAHAALDGANAEIVAITADKAKLSADGQAAQDNTRASRASANAELASLQAELARLEVRLARQASQAITSPVDGIVHRIVANGHLGDLVKAGEALATLVPTTTDRAVEVWIDGNDMPLIRVGAQARIQFEGWPAVQFGGWPALAVGTFVAEVKFVDQTSNAKGQFRVVLLPTHPSAWPAAVYLRQGVRVHAHIQLGVVRLGYELWRQWNGFPPQPSPIAPGGKEGGK